MAREQFGAKPGSDKVRRANLWRYVPLVLAAAGLVLGYAMGWHRYLSLDYLGQSRDSMRNWAADNPVLAPLIFMLVYALSVTLAVPAKPVLTVFGSFLFGFLPASSYSLLAAVAGATAAFLAVRTAFGDFLRRKAGNGAAMLASGFRENAFMYLLALRFAPFIPSSVINIGAALFDVRLRTFVAATTIGTVPAVVAYAWLGQGLDSVLVAAQMEGRLATPYDLLTPQLTIALAGLALLALLAAMVKKGRGAS